MTGTLSTQQTSQTTWEPDTSLLDAAREIAPIVVALSTYWTKVLFAVVGTGSKIILDYVIRRLDAVSAGLKPVERLNLR